MISSDTRSTNPEHFTLILQCWRLPQIILDVWLCLTAGHVDWNEMVDLYVATGVKLQEGSIEDGVVNGAKSLGEMHGAELAPTGPRSQLRQRTNESQVTRTQLPLQSSRIKVSVIPQNLTNQSQAVLFSLCSKLDRLTTGHIGRIRCQDETRNGSQLLIPSKVSCTGIISSIDD